MMLIDAEIMAQNRNPRWRLVRHLGIVVSSSGTTHVVLLLGYISLSNFMQIRCVVLKLWWFEFFADLAWNAYSRPRNFGFRWSEPLNEIGHHRDPQKAHPLPKPHLHANFGTDRSTGATCVRDEKKKKKKKRQGKKLTVANWVFAQITYVDAAICMRGGQSSLPKDPWGYKVAVRRWRRWREGVYTVATEAIRNDCSVKSPPKK